MNAEERRIGFFVVAALAIFVFGFAGGTLSNRDTHGRRFSEERTSNSAYPLINPLLECDVSGDTLSDEFRPSLRAVQETVDRHIEAGDVSSVSVYFRDLNNGPWFGIGQDDAYAASSMLKVAHMMAVFKHAESDPELLQRVVEYTGRYRNDLQTITPEQVIVVGESYSVEELVERIILYSDNEALYLLRDKVPEAEADSVYADLGIEFTVQNEITVREYSSLLRVLFNASYLNEQFSSYALGLLTQTQFGDGLRAGVPSSVYVAHKFGERALQDQLNQLHDCGIIYYPDHPYLLCVMTRGEENEKLTSTIQDISFTVYSQMRAGFDIK